MTPGKRLFLLLWRAKAEQGLYTWEHLPEWRRLDYENAAKEFVDTMIKDPLPSCAGS